MDPADVREYDRVGTDRQDYDDLMATFRNIPVYPPIPPTDPIDDRVVKVVETDDEDDDDDDLYEFITNYEGTGDIKTAKVDIKTAKVDIIKLIDENELVLNY